jgi:putative addiction module component (TIGR02574 family)
MSTDLLEEALKLSPEDRLQLIGDLWDTLSEEEIPVTPEERVLLDSRLADLEANPDDQRTPPLAGGQGPPRTTPALKARVVLRRAAELDLATIEDWYETQQAGLGEDL